jgi:transposase
MFNRKRMINIDESVLQTTDHRRKGWIAKGKKCLRSKAQRLKGMSVIGAATSTGEFYFTVNQGKNNSETFNLFLLKLVKLLDQQNTFWRSDSILMIDNAPYHKSRLSLYTYDQLRLPVMFLGPYQFNMAPVENVFSFIKNRNLN